MNITDRDFFKLCCIEPYDTAAELKAVQQQPKKAGQAAPPRPAAPLLPDPETHEFNAVTDGEHTTLRASDLEKLLSSNRALYAADCAHQAEAQEWKQRALENAAAADHWRKHAGWWRTGFCWLVAAVLAGVGIVEAVCR